MGPETNKSESQKTFEPPAQNLAERAEPKAEKPAEKTEETAYLALAEAGAEEAKKKGINITNSAIGKLDAFKNAA